MKYALLIFIAMGLLPLAAQTVVTTTITSPVLLDPNAISAIIQQNAPTLTGAAGAGTLPSISVIGGVITVQSSRAMTNAELSACHAAFMAQLFTVTTTTNAP
jgi:hypothetical protein